MRSPPLAPGFDFETYIVLDDLGKLGRVYREVDEEYADKATVIRNIIDEQYHDPVRVVSFNTAEGWSRDVSEDIAREMIEQGGAVVQIGSGVCRMCYRGRGARDVALGEEADASFTAEEIPVGRSSKARREAQHQ